jgi:hypothetical protein
VIGVSIRIEIKITSVCLGADCFAFGELLGKAPQVTKGACSWFGPPSSGSFTPVLLRGPAPNGHPCPDGALAASLRLGPLRKTCVQPAPKSRLAVFGLSVLEIKSRSKADQEQIKGFPAEAGPTGCVGCVIVPVPSVRTRSSHDRARALRGYASRDAPRPLSAIPVWLTARGVFVGPSSAGKMPAWAPLVTGRDQVCSRPITNGR